MATKVMRVKEEKRRVGVRSTDPVTGEKVWKWVDADTVKKKGVKTKTVKKDNTVLNSGEKFEETVEVEVKEEDEVENIVEDVSSDEVVDESVDAIVEDTVDEVVEEVLEEPKSNKKSKKRNK